MFKQFMSFHHGIQSNEIQIWSKLDNRAAFPDKEFKEPCLQAEQEQGRNSHSKSSSVMGIMRHAFQLNSAITPNLTTNSRLLPGDQPPVLLIVPKPAVVLTNWGRDAYHSKC